MAFLPGLMVVVGIAPAAMARTIDFPCSKNLADGRVLVDGVAWDRKMAELGYKLKDGAFVPYDVLRFRKLKSQDAIWADGICRMRLGPVQK